MTHGPAVTTTTEASSPSIESKTFLPRGALLEQERSRRTPDGRIRHGRSPLRAGRERSNRPARRRATVPALPSRNDKLVLRACSVERVLRAPGGSPRRARAARSARAAPTRNSCPRAPRQPTKASLASSTNSTSGIREPHDPRTAVTRPVLVPDVELLDEQHVATVAGERMGLSIFAPSPDRTPSALTLASLADASGTSAPNATEYSSNASIERRLSACSSERWAAAIRAASIASAAGS